MYVNLSLHNEGCSDFLCSFPGNKNDKTANNNLVNVYINGRIIPEMTMRFRETKGQCRFLHGNAARPDAALLARLIFNDEVLHSGKNLIRYVHDSTDHHEKCTRFCEAYIFVWNVRDRIVLTDIDGTVTRSDITSVRDTILTDNYNYSDNNVKGDTKNSSNHRSSSVAHRGICRLFADLAGSSETEASCCNDADVSAQQMRNTCIRFVYLTSRPFSLKRATRNFLNAVKQDGHGLPAGPILW